MAGETHRAAGQAVAFQGRQLRYDADLRALPAGLAERFRPLHCDEAARAHLEQAPHGAFITALYMQLRRFMSDYDAYGLLGMYPMHLLSAEQFRQLLGPPRAGARLLDVGAGSGALTALAAHGFEQVITTEASRTMRRKLRARGFRVLTHDLSEAPLPEPVAFDAALCLNVLDRCSRPRSLLSHLLAALRPAGRLLVSVPLPLSPHVHVGAATVEPDELLPEPCEQWELGAARLAHDVLEPAGFRVECLSRAPYLCRGDAREPLYVLDAAVYLCRPQAAVLL